MALGIGREAPIRATVHSQVRTRKGHFSKPEGTPIGVMAVQPKGHQEGDYNPLIVFFTVSPFRKDKKQIIEDRNKKGKLSKYSQSLFYSCFKKW